jgi:adenylate kinase family enzyme
LRRADRAVACVESAGPPGTRSPPPPGPLGVGDGGQGSGKTTLARRVGAQLSAPVYELDWVGWERETGRERTVEEKLERVRAIAAEDTWVTEGTMLGWTDPLLGAADLVVWLDVPWPVAVWRMLLRHARAELAGANPHPGWRRLLRFIWYTRPHPSPATGRRRTPGFTTPAVGALCDIARQAGYTSLYGHTRTSNDRSMAVLRRNRFEDVGLVGRGEDLARKFVKRL